MSFDLARAATFLTGHGRLLDRHRLALSTDDASDRVVAAVDGYRNADGGYGWGLEPDLRAPESQPGGAQHALEAIADARATVPVALLDWLQSASLPDGGLPFALPIADATGCAPFWAGADPTASSLQLTAGVTRHAYRAARHDEQALAHPWFATATRFCFDAIAALDGAPGAHELAFALALLDAASDVRPEALELLRGLGRFVPADGALPVAGGAEGETLHLLEFAPEPGRPVRELVSADAVAADLDRLEGGQREDGGWSVDFDSYSPMAALEWRGYATVQAVQVLRANRR